MLCFVVETKGLNYLNFRGWSIVETNVANDDLTNFTPFQEKFTELASTKHASETMKSVDTLFYLCKKGHLLLLRTLVQDLEYKNPQDDKNYTLLHCAVEFGHSSMVEYLLLSVKDKNPKDSDSMTPLKLATQKEDLPTVALFAPHVNGVDCLDTLFFLCKKGHLDILKCFLQECLNKNPGDKDKYTLMHCAAEHGQLIIVEYLVPLLDDKNPKAGPIKYDDEDELTQDQETPLHLAAEGGHLPVIEFLVPHLNGEINPATSDGMTVLHDAAYFGHLNVVAYYTGILDNPNPGEMSNDDFRGWTPLHAAAQEGHLEVVKHFCNLLKDKNPSDDNGYTPLHMAARRGHIDIVKYLVQYLDNKHPKAGSYWNYETPLDLAKKKGHTEVVNFLENL